MLDRRRGDPHVDLRGAGGAQHADDLRGRVAAHDRVVDDDEPLAGDDLGHRVELQPQAVLAQLLAGLDEGPLDVAVLDEAVVLGQAAGARVAARRRVAGVRAPGSRGRPSTGASRARISPIRPRTTCSVRAAHPRVRAREVDVLEDAERLARALDDLDRLEPVLADRDHLAGAHVAHELGADDVERARLARDAVARRAGRRSAPRRSRSRAGAARPGRGRRRRDPWSSARSRTRRASAASPRRRRPRPAPPRALAISAAMISESDVEANSTPAARSSACSSTALIRLPLWASASSRRLPRAAGRALHRLRVLPGVRAGRRVAHVADRQLAAERGDVVSR